MPNYPFAGQIIVITGASLGIGAATAIYLACKGATLVLNGRNEERLQTLKSRIDAEKGKSLIVSGDINLQATIDQLITLTLNKFERIDAVVNNAGGGTGQCAIEELSDDDWEQNLSSNLTSTFRVCRKIAPIMKHQGYGRIVNVSSVAGRTHSYLAGHGYSAAKAGLQGFTRHLALELGCYGITVNAVAPGITKTDRIVQKWQLRSEKEQQDIINTIALHRLAEPEEIASAIAFLISNEASYITGVTLDINGGAFMS